jgi:hypothetical protein
MIEIFLHSDVLVTRPFRAVLGGLLIYGYVIFMIRYGMCLSQWLEPGLYSILVEISTHTSMDKI